jgi:hypothetical protein
MGLTGCVFFVKLSAWLWRVLVTMSEVVINSLEALVAELTIDDFLYAGWISSSI